MLILLPPPKQMAEVGGDLLLGADSMIVMDPSAPPGARVYAKQLQEEIEVFGGIRMEITRGLAGSGDILLSVDPGLKEQSYTLQVTDAGATLCGGSLNALGWAVQTLRQIVRQCGAMLPGVEIADEPVLENRGFYHDLTRGRVQTLENLKKLADTLSFYKINQLQLYVEHTYLFRDMSELWRDETPITAEEILELDQYCYERGIELIPSLSTFGHLYKLLSTNSYGDLCERPECTNREFSFRERMDHHTINVSNPQGILLVEKMMEEYMSLFRTNYFNICADETFDLGKGRSAHLAKEKGTERLYVDYIQELFRFLIEKGKTPMFWGDIITRNPELIKELPDEVICLNWGYLPFQRDAETRILAEAGAKQYLCPGVCGWNTWVNAIWNSYQNISHMGSYAVQYGGLGLLNTDWGDFGHVNDPAFSVPGLIYGAVCAWAGSMPDYEEINRQISLLEYGDSSGQIVGLLAHINDDCTAFSWNHVVNLKEGIQKGLPRQRMKHLFFEEDMGKVAQCNEKIETLQRKLREASRSMDSRNRGIVGKASLSLEMIRCWNLTGQLLADPGRTKEEGGRIATALERALHHYQDQWRANSKEGDLGRISEVFFWYADILRGGEDIWAYEERSDLSREA